MPDPKLLLWIDVESTGLLTDYHAPTMLECAWTVTGPTGEQLTALCQAFTALPLVPGQTALDLPQPAAEADGSHTGYWDAPNYPSPAVRTMHEAGGLTTEHAAFTEDHPDRVLRNWAELERLWLDDLHAAGWHGLDRGQVLIAGGGVSHMEDRFVRHYAPRVFTDPRVHYSTGADVSTVLRTLRTRTTDASNPVPGRADHLIAAHVGDMREPGRDYRWSQIGFSPTRYDAADRCGWSRYAATGGEQTTPHWAVMEEDNHRAAPGIARSLMAYRLLPRLLEP